MKRTRRVVILVFGFAAFLTVFVIIRTRFERTNQGYHPEFSTYYDDKFGTMAFYEALEQAGYTAERNHSRFYAREDLLHEDSASLILIDPGYYMDSEEESRLFELVDSGFHLVLVGAGESIMPENLGLHAKDNRKYLHDVNDGFFADERKIHLKPASPDRLFDEPVNLEYQRDEEQVEWSWNSPMINRRFMQNYYSDSLPFRPLLTDSGEVHVAMASHGKGKIWLISHPWMFSNRGLTRAGNAKFVMNLIARIHAEHPGKFIIDEYYHGFRLESVKTPLNEPEVRAMIIGLILLFIFTVYSLSRRRLIAVPERIEPRRNILEYVSSVALLYRRKGQGHFLFEEVKSRFLTRIRAHLGLSRPDAVRDMNLVGRSASLKFGEAEAAELVQLLQSLHTMSKSSPEPLRLHLLKKMREYSRRHKLDLHGF